MSVSVTSFGVAVVDGDTHISQWVIDTKRLDCDEFCRSVAERFLVPGDVVVDGGACIGDQTVTFLKAVGKSGRVLAFEPGSESYQCLCFNCPRAEKYHIGLGRSEDRMSFVRLENLGASYLTKENDESLNMVRVTDLDSLNLKKLKLLKLDIEGMELEALQGARNTLVACRPIVMLELNDFTLSRRNAKRKSIIRLLGTMGYKPENPESMKQPQVDVIFLP